MVKLMIVEDNENILSQCSKYLSTKDNISIVATAKNGKKALKLCKEIQPNLVLLDLGLPLMNGINIIDQISRIESIKTNFIVISGNETLRHRFYNTKQVYKIIPKPCNMSTIMNAITEFETENSKTFPLTKLNQILLKLNLKVYSKSCSHLSEVIEFSYNNSHMLENLNAIYSIIASRHNCSSEKIKSSVRSSIRIVNNSANSNLLRSIFYLEDEDYNKTLTPKYFVNCIIDYLNN